MLDNQEKERNKGQKFCTGRIVIIAIGEIPALKTDGEQVTLYVFLRAACAEHDAVMTAERQKEYEAVCRKVQTMLNNKK